MNDIKFRHVTIDDLSDIAHWLAEPHIMEFWDNSLGHKKDIEIFANGRKEKSDYFDGCFTYWLAEDTEPYAMLMTSKLQPHDDFPKAWIPYLPQQGYASSIDYMIGNTKYFGKGYGVKTLRLFTDFLYEQSKHACNTFIIDPDMSNPRAMHVYEKAGFEKKGTFKMEGGYFDGSESMLMVMKMEL